MSCDQNTDKKQEEKGYYVNNTITAGGIKDPAENLPWLKELIQKAKTDKTGNYLGCIWLVSHNEQDYFVTNMMLGSGGIMYWIFDCKGNHFTRRDENCTADKFVGKKHFHEDDYEDFSSFPFDFKKDVVVYSSLLDVCE